MGERFPRPGGPRATIGFEALRPRHLWLFGPDFRAGRRVGRSFPWPIRSFPRPGQTFRRVGKDEKPPVPNQNPVVLRRETLDVRLTFPTGRALPCHRRFPAFPRKGTPSNGRYGVPGGGYGVPGEGYGVPGGGNSVPSGGNSVPSGGNSVPSGGYGVQSEGYGVPSGGYGVPGGGYGVQRRRIRRARRRIRRARRRIRRATRRERRARRRIRRATRRERRAKRRERRAKRREQRAKRREQRASTLPPPPTALDARPLFPCASSRQPADVTERARFLLDEFPTRDRNEPDGGTQSPAPEGQSRASPGRTPPGRHYTGRVLGMEAEPVCRQKKGAGLRRPG